MKKLLNVLCLMAIGGILAAAGIGIDSWQLWVVLFLTGLVGIIERSYPD